MLTWKYSAISIRTFTEPLELPLSRSPRCRWEAPSSSASFSCDNFAFVRKVKIRLSLRLLYKWWNWQNVPHDFLSKRFSLCCIHSAGLMKRQTFFLLSSSCKQMIKHYWVLISKKSLFEFRIHWRSKDHSDCNYCMNMLWLRWKPFVFQLIKQGAYEQPWSVCRILQIKLV